MKFTTNDNYLFDELLLILKLFYSAKEIEQCKEQINQEITLDFNTLHNTISIVGEKPFSHSKTTVLSKQELNNVTKYKKQYCKIALYEALQGYTNKILPWGTLTGIRPTKLFYELKKEFGSAILAKNQLISKYYVSPQKAEVVYETVKHQTKMEINDNLIDFYINIPFCTSKCYYCSFISVPLNKCEQFITPYVNALITEIRAAKQIIKNNNYIVKSIYIGGGTPTSLSAENLDKILSELNYPVKEFTVEAGRPDTITKEKLDVLKKHNVTRISINPQTFSNKTLKLIGREHTSEDIIKTYNLAKPYNFEINMDLIAGLKNESFLTFKKSLTKTLELNPQNITVHTLSVKRTSELSEEENKSLTSELEVGKMVDYAYSTLIKNNYFPYYLYKQKNMIGNLENIGYAKPKTECIFNIDTMEEVASVIACGANAISKRFYSLQNRIERQPNVKNLSDYISRVQEMIAKKQEFFNKSK